MTDKSIARHTKGPWETLAEECDKPYIRVRGTALGGRYKIANVLTPVYEGVHPRESEETRANARLLAAAPELLEALNNILVAMEASGGWVGDDGLFDAGMKAYKKATGAKS